MPNHAYSVLDGVQLKLPDGKPGPKLIKMRNPMGLERYYGPWSDYSKLWTKAYKKQVDLKVNNEGIFYVPLDKWRSFFTNIWSTHWHDDYFKSNIEGDTKSFSSGIN